MAALFFSVSTFNEPAALREDRLCAFGELCVGRRGADLRRGPAFDLRAESGRVLNLMAKYGDVPMSLTDACLVRMTELLADPVL